MNILNFFLRTKFYFKLPKKNKVLEYKNSRFLSNSYYLDPYLEIYVLILLKSLLKPKTNNLYLNYCIEYFSHVRPRHVITFFDNDIRFYKFKSFFNNIIFISIQNGHRGLIGDGLLEIKLNKKKFNLSCDYMFLFNKYIKSEVNKYIKANKFVIGSYKSNNYKILAKKKTKVKVIGFISQFTDYDNQFGEIFYKNNKISISLREYYLAETKILGIISNFCINNKLNLTIIPRTNSVEEFNFYKNSLKNCNWTFAEKKKMTDSYKIIHNCDCIFGIDGTMLYECLSRKIPTGALSIRGDLLGKKKNLDMSDHNFCWPKKIKKTGLFWTNIDSDKEVLRVLNFVTFISKKKWEKVIKKFSNIVMLYDFNNKILKKEIAEISQNLDLNNFLIAKK